MADQSDSTLYLAAGKTQPLRAAFALPWSGLFAAASGLLIFCVVAAPVLDWAQTSGSVDGGTALVVCALVSFVIGAIAFLPGSMQWNAGYRVEMDHDGITVRTLFGPWHLPFEIIERIGEYGSTMDVGGRYASSVERRPAWRPRAERGLFIQLSRGYVLIDDTALSSSAQIALRTAFRSYASSTTLRFSHIGAAPKAITLHPIRRLVADPRTAGRDVQTASTPAARPSLAPAPRPSLAP